MWFEQIDIKKILCYEPKAQFFYPRQAKLDFDGVDSQGKCRYLNYDFTERAGGQGIMRELS